MLLVSPETQQVLNSEKKINVEFYLKFILNHFKF